MRRFVAGLAVAGGSQMLGSAVDLQVIGQWQAPSFAMDLAVDGEFAYMVDHSEGLQILSVSNPAHPQKVGSLRTSSGTWSVALSGSYAYVAADESGLHVIDVSHPNSPTKVGEWTNAPCTAVRVFGTYAFVETPLVGPGRVRLLDLSNPRDPTEVAAVIYRPHSVESNGLAYTVDLWDGLLVLDFKDPRNPMLLGSYDTDPTVGSTTSVAVSGGYAYVTDNDFFGLKGRGLVIVDVSDSANPHSVAERWTWASANLVAVAGQRAFVASSRSWDLSSYIDVFDVRNPHQPERIQSLSLDGRGTACAMVVQGSFIYLAFQGLEIVQVLERPSFAVPVLDVSGSLRLRVSGEVGETVRVQYSDNLQEWIDWQTVSFTSPDLDLIDERGRPEGRRFYRAVAP